MKHFLKTIVIAIMIMTCGMAATAQTNNKQQLSREELATKQAQYIAQKLVLDKQTTDRYIETYCQYQKEVWALGSRKNLNLTAAQRLERSQEILDLRKKYYKKYSKFLSEQQLDKAYKIEKQLLDRMRKNKTNKKHR